VSALISVVFPWSMWPAVPRVSGLRAFTIAAQLERQR
jgi:hypothetical protein